MKFEFIGTQRGNQTTIIAVKKRTFTPKVSKKAHVSLSSEDTVHKKFVVQVQTVNVNLYYDFLRRFRTDGYQAKMSSKTSVSQTKRNARLH